MSERPDTFPNTTEPVWYPTYAAGVISEVVSGVPTRIGTSSVTVHGASILKSKTGRTPEEAVTNTLRHYEELLAEEEDPNGLYASNIRKMIQSIKDFSSKMAGPNAVSDDDSHELTEAVDPSYRVGTPIWRVYPAKKNSKLASGTLARAYSAPAWGYEARNILRDGEPLYDETWVADEIGLTPSEAVRKMVTKLQDSVNLFTSQGVKEPPVTQEDVEFVRSLDPVTPDTVSDDDAHELTESTRPWQQGDACWVWDFPKPATVITERATVQDAIPQEHPYVKIDGGNYFQTGGEFPAFRSEAECARAALAVCHKYLASCPEHLRDNWRARARILEAMLPADVDAPSDDDSHELNEAATPWPQNSPVWVVDGRGEVPRLFHGIVLNGDRLLVWVSDPSLTDWARFKFGLVQSTAPAAVEAYIREGRPAPSKEDIIALQRQIPPDLDTPSDDDAHELTESAYIPPKVGETVWGVDGPGHGNKLQKGVLTQVQNSHGHQDLKVLWDGEPSSTSWSVYTPARTPQEAIDYAVFRARRNWEHHINKEVDPVQKEAYIRGREHEVAELKKLAPPDAHTVSDDDAHELTESVPHGDGIPWSAGDLGWVAWIGHSGVASLTHVRIVNGTKTALDVQSANGPEGAVRVIRKLVRHTPEDAIQVLMKFRKEFGTPEASAKLRALLPKSPDTVSDDDEHELTESSNTDVYTVCEVYDGKFEMCSGKAYRVPGNYSFLTVSNSGPNGGYTTLRELVGKTPGEAVALYLARNGRRTPAILRKVKALVAGPDLAADDDSHELTESVKDFPVGSRVHEVNFKTDGTQDWIVPYTKSGTVDAVDGDERSVRWDRWSRSERVGVVRLYSNLLDAVDARIEATRKAGSNCSWGGRWTVGLENLIELRASLVSADTPSDDDSHELTESTTYPTAYYISWDTDRTPELCSGRCNMQAGMNRTYAVWSADGSRYTPLWSRPFSDPVSAVRDELESRHTAADRAKLLQLLASIQGPDTPSDDDSHELTESRRVVPYPVTLGKAEAVNTLAWATPFDRQQAEVIDLANGHGEISVFLMNEQRRVLLNPWNVGNTFEKLAHNVLSHLRTVDSWRSAGVRPEVLKAIAEWEAALPASADQPSDDDSHELTESTDLKVGDPVFILNWDEDENGEFTLPSVLPSTVLKFVQNGLVKVENGRFPRSRSGLHATAEEAVNQGIREMHKELAQRDWSEPRKSLENLHKLLPASANRSSDDDSHELTESANMRMPVPSVGDVLWYVSKAKTSDPREGKSPVQGTVAKVTRFDVGKTFESWTADMSNGDYVLSMEAFPSKDALVRKRMSVYKANAESPNLRDEVKQYNLEQLAKWTEYLDAGVDTPSDDDSHELTEAKLANVGDLAYDDRWHQIGPVVEQGGNINAKSKNGNTALHYAARQGSVDIVQRLLALGANPNAKGNNDITPIMMALKDTDSTIILDVLLNAKASLTRLDDGHWTCAHYAAQNPDRQCRALKWLIAHKKQFNAIKEHATDQGETPVCKATNNSRLEVLRTLLDAGCKATTEAVDCAYRANAAAHLTMLLNHGAVPKQGLENTSTYPKECNAILRAWHHARSAHTESDDAGFELTEAVSG